MVDLEQSLSTQSDSGLPSEAGEVIAWGGPFAVIFAREHERKEIVDSVRQISPEDTVELTPLQFERSTGNYPRGTTILVNVGSVNQLLRLAPSLTILRYRSGLDTCVRFFVDNTPRQKDDWQRESDAEEWLRATMKPLTVEPNPNEDG